MITPSSPQASPQPSSRGPVRSPQPGQSQGAQVHDARSGLLLALAGFAMLSAGDAIVKSLGGAWPGTAVAALRYVLGWAGLTVLVAFSLGRKGFVCPRPGLQFMRGASVALSTFGFFMGVQAMPLANATAILFISPAITAIFSAVFLKERASVAVWCAVGLAFVGMLIVLRPEVARLGFAAAYPLVAAFGMAGVMLGNRAAAGSAPALTLQWLMASFAMPLLVAAAVIGDRMGPAAMHIQVPSLGVLIGCAAVAVTGTSAHWLLYLGAERASATVTAPMVYSQLIFAAILGRVFFGNVLDMPTIAGAVLIIIAGLILWRAQARRPMILESD